MNRMRLRPATGCPTGRGRPGLLLVSLASILIGGLADVDAEAIDPGTTERIQARRQLEEQRLERIQIEIEELRERLIRSESTAGSIVDALDEIDLKFALLRREAQSLEFKADTARRAYEVAETRAAAIRRDLETSQEAVRSWLLEVYKTGPTRYLRVVAASASPAEIAAAQRVVETLSLMESRRIERLRTDQIRMNAALDELAESRRTVARLREELRRREAGVLLARREKATLLAQIRDQQVSQETVMRELVQVENAIQQLLRSLSENDIESSNPSRGFARFRGLLNRPVDGRLLVPYGNVRHPRFRTEVPHPGIDIAAEPGDEVRVVFDGRVVFSDWFRGYGQLIVIDHADTFLSIYGHLGERLVEVGQETYEGDLIARSGEGGTLDSPGLYFEIRHNGKPEDPSPWLRPRSNDSYARSRSDR